MRRRASSSGFTLMELIVVMLVSGFIAMSLHRAHVQQRQFAGWQQARAASHDALRVASSLLGADIREAVVAAGDLSLDSESSLSVRSPVGWAFVCAVDTGTDRVGLQGVQGHLPTGAADSVFVYGSSGWQAVSASVLQDQALACAHGVSTPEAELDLVTSNVEDIPVGAPVRVFRTHAYHVMTHRGEPWLGMSTSTGTEALLGPLVTDGLRFRLLDGDGAETSTPADVAAVEVRLILPTPASYAFGGNVADTLLTVFQSRNR